MVHDDVLAQADSSAAESAAETAMTAVNRVQYLLAVVWDIFIGSSTVLFGWAFLRKRSTVDRVLGIGLAVLGGALLYFNIAAFPYGPAYVGSIDVGPFCGIWFLVLFVRLIVFTFLKSSWPEWLSRSTCLTR
jgi:hypothetical protein